MSRLLFILAAFMFSFCVMVCVGAGLVASTQTEEVALSVPAPASAPVVQQAQVAAPVITPAINTHPQMAQQAAEMERQIFQQASHPQPAQVNETPAPQPNPQIQLVANVQPAPVATVDNGQQLVESQKKLEAANETIRRYREYRDEVDGWFSSHGYPGHGGSVSNVGESGEKVLSFSPSTRSQVQSEGQPYCESCNKGGNCATCNKGGRW